MKGLAFSRRADKSLVVGLSAIALLLWMGGSSILPLLPVYLRHSGSSTALVGVTMGAYFAASVVTQFPVGRLADAVGCAPVIIVGLLVFAGGSCGFALASGPAGAIGFRALQGTGAGAVLVASATMIARQIDLSEQGRAFGVLYGAQMLALAVGPILGTVFGLGAMRELFLAAAAVALVALVPVLGCVRPLERASARRFHDEPGASTFEASMTGGPEGMSPRMRRRAGSFRISSPLVGAALAFAATGLLGGLYETCWTLLLNRRHATTLDIGLSWTLYALPFALLSLAAGRAAERYDRRMLAYVSLLSSAGFALLYPFLHVVALLVGLAVFEASAAVVASPAAVLVLTEAVPLEHQGEAQGAIETARTAAMALGAIASGSLFAVATVLPFELAAVVIAALVALVAWCWRAVPGRLPRSQSALDPIDETLSLG